MAVTAQKNIDWSKPLRNVREERFAQLVFQGESQIAAYRKAFGGKAAKWKPATIYSRASELARKILGRIESLKSNSVDESIVSHGEACGVLSEIIRRSGAGSAKIRALDRVKAIERLAKMRGYDSPKRHEVMGRDGQPLSVIHAAMSPEEALALYKAKIHHAEGDMVGAEVVEGAMEGAQ